MDSQFNSVMAHSRVHPRFNTPLLAVFGFFTLTIVCGCLTKPSDQGSDKPALEDNDRRAGASSSTNWPSETGGTTEVHVLVASLNPLRLTFTQSLGLANDPDQHPVRLSGKISLYRGNTIPALTPPVTQSLTFSNSDSVLIPVAMIHALANASEDSLPFNVRIQTDTSEGWIFGMLEIQSSQKIIETPLSIETDTQLVLHPPETRFLGMIDTTGKFAPYSPGGKTTLCFYIPGSPFFGAVDADVFKIGPLPKTNFPLRLLRMTHLDATNGTQVEGYTVQGFQRQLSDSLYVFTPDRKIFSERISGSLSLRPN